ncbi:MAG: fibronectin type III domain-containing protein [Terracidiphilus sp.]|jgi:hypothetical protein
MKVVSQRALPAAMALSVAGALFFTGCGTPGAPMPPSLKLPDPVNDLSASRTGNQVSLTWTMPKKNTDKLLLKGNLPVRICRKEGSGTCASVDAALQLAPDAHGAFTETLASALAAGPPRSLTYFIELKNRHGRSAGLSNAAVVLAGEAPAPVAGLSAQVRKEGVVLRWTPGPEASQPSSPTVIRLHRKLLTPQPKAESAKPPSQQGILAPPPEPLEQSLLVDSGVQSGRSPDRALDKEIRFGQTYEYRAQRVARLTVGAETLELAGPLSDPVRVEAQDVFPPDVPAGLAAVATAAGVATEPSIDLSWQPVTDADLAGYLVYRRQGDAANGTWQRISPPQPLIGPAFHDAHVQPGHTYRYAVSAIDQLGHESARSPEAEETVPNP